MSVYDILVVNKLTYGRIVELISHTKKSLNFKNFRNLLNILVFCEYLENNTEKCNGFKSMTKSSVSRNAQYGESLRISSQIAMVIRHFILLITTGMTLYVRWWLMGSMPPIFQKIDNPASFEENFFIRVSNLKVVRFHLPTHILTEIITFRF